MAVWVPTQALGVQQVLFRLIGANMNVTTDQVFVPYLWTPGQQYLIERIRAVNPSISLTTAAGGVYTAASKGGNTLVLSSQVYTGATNATSGQDLTLASQGAGLRTEIPILSLTTAQGAAATADFYIFGSLIGGL